MRAIEKEPFEQAYNQMMEREIKASRGERKSRLQKDHGFLEKLFLEKVWWPAVGSLEYVHPEYENPRLQGRIEVLRFCLSSAQGEQDSA
mgnify:CR=1 FL=1